MTSMFSKFGQPVADVQADRSSGSLNRIEAIDTIFGHASLQDDCKTRVANRSASHCGIR